MLWHQIGNSMGDDIYNAVLYDKIEYMPHLHLAAEIAYVTEGAVHAEADGKAYELQKGDCLLVMPYRVHSYKGESGSLTAVAVFSDNYAPAFMRQYKGKVPSQAVTKLSKSASEFLCSTIFAYRREEFNGATLHIKRPDRYTTMAALYAVLGEFDSTAEFVESARDNRLEFAILNYIENNYASDISLMTMAEALGYDYRYLSLIFKRTFGVGFRTLLNQYRCDAAESLIQSSDLSLSEIAMNSGFQSIRSFNRVFRETAGCTPSEFGKK